MVKQYTNGYFEKGAWKCGNYEDDVKFAEYMISLSHQKSKMNDIMDVDLRPVRWNYGELTNVQSKCSDCPCITGPEPSYAGLWIIGVSLIILLIFAIIIILNL